MEQRNAAQENQAAKKDEILRVAQRLFIQQGYENTSMRQIARAAGVSVGLIAYHFAAKENMAYEVAQGLFQRFCGLAHAYVDIREEPLLYSAVLLNLNNRVLSTEKYHTFYCDMLRNDILLKVVFASGIDSSIAARDKYCPEMSESEIERIGWYVNYVSIGMERSLVLHIDDACLPEEPLPDLIFGAYMSLWTFPGAQALVKEAKVRGRELAGRIMVEHPEIFD